MAQIQWYPGHMSKAKREIEDRLKMVDMIIELVDGRAPYSSKNPMFDAMLKTKPRLIIITKIDMADPQKTEEWINYYRSKGNYVLAVNLKKFNEYGKIITICKEAIKDKLEKEKARGLKPRAVRAIIVGIPNVGKSTLINRLAKRNSAVTGNKPGVTKSQQLIRISNDFELFDTPGVLWPKFESEDIAYHMALIGSIKTSILPLDEVVIYAIKYLEKAYPGLLESRYNIDPIDFDTDWIEPVFTKISDNRKIKRINKEVDYDRVIELLVNEILDCSIGKITWESVSDYEK